MTPETSMEPDLRCHNRDNKCGLHVFRNKRTAFKAKGAEGQIRVKLFIQLCEASVPNLGSFSVMYAKLLGFSHNGDEDMDIFNKSYSYRSHFCDALSFAKRQGKLTQNKEIKVIRRKSHPPKPIEEE